MDEKRGDENGYRLGQRGVYEDWPQNEEESFACGCQSHPMYSPFTPICYICMSAIERTVQSGCWKKKNDENTVRLSESDVEWTQWYRASSFLPFLFFLPITLTYAPSVLSRLFVSFRATVFSEVEEQSHARLPLTCRAVPVIFNRNHEIALSEVEHIIYDGPWLELLQLPVKENESGDCKPVKFFPLCLYLNEAEEDHNTFGCTIHAVCWDFLQRALGKNIPTSSLPKITQVLREQLLPPSDGRLDVKENKKAFAPRRSHINLPAGIWRACEKKIVHVLCNPKDIPELDLVYRSCEKRTQPYWGCEKRGLDDGHSGGFSEDSFESRYASLPHDIKAMIAEYVEGRVLSTTADVGRTLPEYWQKRLFRRYPNVLFEAQKYALEDVDWQLLYYKANLLMSSHIPSSGWQNRCRIFKCLWGTCVRYFEKTKVEPSPKELMICYDKDGRGRGHPRFRFGYG